jgi:hypothetical protein
MPVTDEDAALAAIATLETLSAEQQEALDAINTVVHNGEPFVDIHELIAHYNVLYFRRLLWPRVEVIWSPRLTLVSTYALHPDPMAICDRLVVPDAGLTIRRFAPHASRLD